MPQSPDQLSKHPLKWANANGLQYAYIDAGAASQPALVFLHGFPDMANTWDTTINSMQRHFRCIAPFLRGYYPTDIPANGDYTAKTVATDVIDLMQTLGIDTYCVVGHDWGATVAYAMANLAPANIKKLITLAIPHPAVITPFSLAKYYPHFIKFFFEGKKKAAQRTRSNNMLRIDQFYGKWAPNWRNSDNPRERIKKEFERPGRVEAALGYYFSFMNNAFNLKLLRFYQQLPQMPTLTFVGKSDPTASMKLFNQMKKKMGEGLTLVELNQEGHFVHLEGQKTFEKHLKQFLGV